MFKLPDLPYSYDGLEPHIDARTMEIHHSKHHQAYVDKLNAVLEGNEWLDKPLEEILQNLDKLPADKKTAVQNNGGGHFNHCLFWEIMSPTGGNQPTGNLLEKINQAFGSFDDFKKQVAEAAVARFGSGWVWLIPDGERLKIVSTPNQDSPLMEGVSPILGLDVWEHAYYLKYQNRRPDYIEAWWNVVNWDSISKSFNG